MRKKIGLLDKRWAVKLQDLTIKVDRQLAEIEKMLSIHAKTSPVATNIRHIQSARRELAAVSAFANFTKSIVRNTDEVRA